MRDVEGPMILLCFLILIIGMFAGFMIGYPRITAMDVYQGKTTLEITYRDGVAVDSCVVFKDDRK